MRSRETPGICKSNNIWIKKILKEKWVIGIEGNTNMTYKNRWNAVKSVFREKFIAYIIKEERSKISSKKKSKSKVTSWKKRPYYYHV